MWVERAQTERLIFAALLTSHLVGCAACPIPSARHMDIACESPACDEAPPEGPTKPAPDQLSSVAIERRRWLERIGKYFGPDEKATDASALPPRSRFHPVPTRPAFAPLPPPPLTVTEELPTPAPIEPQPATPPVPETLTPARDSTLKPTETPKLDAVDREAAKGGQLGDFVI